MLLVDSNRSAPPVREHPALKDFRRDPRVRLIEESHSRCSAAARNAGLRAARSEWVTYLDDDDVYLPPKIGRQLDRAQATASPLVLCGYTAVMPRRRRTRQSAAHEYRGDAMLTDATWCTPLIFHRRDPSLYFDETLRAGEDEVFAHAFIAKHRLRVVPNCAEALVEIHPQVEGRRVHRNTEAVWRAYRANWRQVRGLYSGDGLRAYLAMGRLVRAQGGHGGLAHFLGCARSVLKNRGARAWRLVANATAHRLGFFNRWLVS